MQRGPKATSALLLSIKQEHALRIFDGSKRYELRKTLPKQPFRRVYLYETGGVGVVGCFDVGQIIKKPVAELWAAVGLAATTQERFASYFANANDGYAIEIKNVSRFETPLTAKELNGNFSRLVPPQNFLILEPGQPLFTVLETRRAVALRRRPPEVTLCTIEKDQHETYRKLVFRHISPYYSDIDETFAEANLRTHVRGSDPVGFFTFRKEVLSIYNSRGKCIGFTTLTYKSGGCVKSGPTILFKPFRDRGFGSATRQAIEARAREADCRKIYCTCPDTSEATIRYLLSAGMRIEGHLEKHYSSDHDELVFGKLLIADQVGELLARDLRSRRAVIAEPKEFKREQLVSDFCQMFRNTWSPLARDDARAIIHQCMDPTAVKPEQKPKRLICLKAQKNCVGAVALLPKRGGSVKGVLCRSTSFEQSISELLTSAVSKAVELGGRRLYFLHPILDSQAIFLLRKLGFRGEGLLRAPYRPGQDVIVMAKFL